MAEWLTTGTVARLLGCSTETVRHYEAEGLVRAVRDSTGKRLLDPRDVETLRQYRATRRGRRDPFDDPDEDGEDD